MLSALRFTALATGGEPRPAWSLAAVDDDRLAAADYLAVDPDHRRARDVRVRGLFEDRRRLEARFFPVGLVLLAEAEAGLDRRQAIASLFAALPPGPLRYYGSWPGIPPDADDLALALALLPHAAAIPPGRLDDLLAPLEHAAGPDGVAPTWLVASGERASASGIEWLGEDCTAVRAALAAGLASARPPGASRWLAPNLGNVLDRWDGERFGGAFHYREPWVRLQVARALAALRPGDLAAGEGARARRIGAEMRARLLAEQRPDGSWGGPLDSALSLEALGLLGPEPARVAAALRFLSETQEADGSWPEAPLYVIPGKGGPGSWYRSREVTTALVLRALARGLRSALVAVPAEVPR